MVSFYYDFGLWQGLLGDATFIFMVQNLYEIYSLAHKWRQKYYILIVVDLFLLHGSHN
jgi:hypothetical protein